MKSALALAPPEPAFVKPVTWRSSRPGVAPIEPPDPARETWRVLVSQNDPIQIKTPRWQPLPAERAIELAMPEGSGFRCRVLPLEVVAQADELGARLQAWVLSRRLLCSSDGFAAWTEHEHALRVRPDGTRELGRQGGALLREQTPGQAVRHTYVLLRAEAEVRHATTGPPRILPGVRVDD